MSTLQQVSSLLGIIGIVWLVLDVTLFPVLRKPKLEVRTRPWKPREPVPWRFAVVDIRNSSPPRWAPFLTRETASDCRVEIQFYRQDKAATPPIEARWSDRPEPFRLSPDPYSRTLVPVPAPELIPDSRWYDLPADDRWREVAVAVLLDGEAYGWGAESYLHGWRNPDWKLERGDYEVRLSIRGGGVKKVAKFRLPYLSDDNSTFQLHPL
jgi:hypothetical protein